MIRHMYWLSILMLFFLMNCKFWNPTSPSPATETPNIIMIDNINSIPDTNDAVAINEAKINNNLLQINVSYAGGCKKHEFQLYGLKGILKSNPPQVIIYLHHNANGDMCEAYLTEGIEFNLLPLKSEYQQQFNNNGPLLLRIFEPNAAEPFQPLPLYKF